MNVSHECALLLFPSPDYATLKKRVAKAVAEGNPSSAEGVATIDVAVETLKVAEHLTPLLMEQLK